MNISSLKREKKKKRKGRNLREVAMEGEKKGGNFLL